eukprot:328163_1
MSSLPPRFCVRCGGISMIVSQILFVCAWILNTDSYPIYDVRNEEDVVALHNELSSPLHRKKAEASVVCIWISFPLLLCALYTLRGLLVDVVKGTMGEMCIYVMEKSVIIWMSIMYIILPALTLIAVSYNWSFHETTADDLTIPTGYYMQLYAIFLSLELVDCAAIADATFTMSIFIAVRLLLYGSDPKNLKFLKFRNIIILLPSRVLIAEVMACCCVVVLFVIFCIILFEFAESGFFSPVGYAKFLIVGVILVKIYIGLKIIVCSTKKRYEQIKELLENDDCNDDRNVGDYQMANTGMDSPGGDIR